MNNSDYICELCLETVKQYEPHVRSGVDQVVCDKDGNYYSMMNNQVMVTAVFHTECIEATMDHDDVDETPYLEEARQLINNQLKSSDGKPKMNPLVMMKGVATA